MANCMRLDPRRRFIYGFTIEDTTMKLWYVDRVVVHLSDPFNFIEVRLESVFAIIPCSLPLGPSHTTPFRVGNHVRIAVPAWLRPDHVFGHGK